MGAYHQLIVIGDAIELETVRRAVEMGYSLEEIEANHVLSRSVKSGLLIDCWQRYPYNGFDAHQV